MPHMDKYKNSKKKMPKKMPKGKKMDYDGDYDESSSKSDKSYYRPMDNYPKMHNDEY